jgi:hypothetical protein
MSRGHLLENEMMDDMYRKVERKQTTGVTETVKDPRGVTYYSDTLNDKIYIILKSKLHVHGGHITTTLPTPNISSTD